jgi:hypothetical protein
VSSRNAAAGDDALWLGIVVGTGATFHHSWRKREILRGRPCLLCRPMLLSPKYSMSSWSELCAASCRSSNAPSATTDSQMTRVIIGYQAFSLPERNIWTQG